MPAAGIQWRQSRSCNMQRSSSRSPPSSPKWKTVIGGNGESMRDPPPTSSHHADRLPRRRSHEKPPAQLATPQTTIRIPQFKHSGLSSAGSACRDPHARCAAVGSSRCRCSFGSILSEQAPPTRTRGCNSSLATSCLMILRSTSISRRDTAISQLSRRWLLLART